MTVGYMREAATTTSFTFFKLLFRWQGSVWKAVHPELFTWLFCYLTISCTYRFVLRGTDYGILFEKIVMNTEHYLDKVSGSLNFVLGFYVSYVATRWWYTFTQLPWPDNLFGQFASFFKSRGTEFQKEEQNIRMSVSRYWNAAFILVLRDICESTHKRFPTLEFMVPSVLTRDELEIIERVSNHDPQLRSTCLYWIPIGWIMKMFKKAEQRGNLTDLQYSTLTTELMKTRHCLNNLLSQDFLCSTPLSYTQVASLTPVIYFIMCLIGRQFVNVGSDATPRIDYVFPFYSVYEFIIYFGWLKVAQIMLNPFGLDDDDLETDWLIQRNYGYGRLIFSQIYEFTPNVVDMELTMLPHTRASAQIAAKRNPMVGSVANLKMTEEEKTRLILPDYLPFIDKVEPRFGRVIIPDTTVRYPPSRYEAPQVLHASLRTSIDKSFQNPPHTQIRTVQTELKNVNKSEKGVPKEVATSDKMKPKESPAPRQKSLERKSGEKISGENGWGSKKIQRPVGAAKEIIEKKEVMEEDKTQTLQRTELLKPRINASSSNIRQRTRYSKLLQPKKTVAESDHIDKTQREETTSQGKTSQMQSKPDKFEDATQASPSPYGSEPATKKTSSRQSNSRLS